MSAYALYRLPHADQYTQIEGETCECLSCTQLNGQSGFVIAPFEVKLGQPIVLIRPDKVTSHPMPLTSPLSFPPCPPLSLTSSPLPCLIKRCKLFLLLHPHHGPLWPLMRGTLSLVLLSFIPVTPSHHSHLLTWD